MKGTRTVTIFRDGRSIAMHAGVLGVTVFTESDGWTVCVDYRAKNGRVYSPLYAGCGALDILHEVILT